MKTCTICFMVTGGINVEAEDEEDALNYFASDAGQEAAGMCLAQNQVTVTEVFENKD